MSVSQNPFRQSIQRRFRQSLPQSFRQAFRRPPDNSRMIFVLGYRTLAFVDGLRRKAVGTIPVSGSPFAIAANPRTGKLYLTELDANRLAVVDAVHRRKIASLRSGIEPSGVAIHRGTNRIYVANGGSDTVTVFSGATNRVIRRVRVKGGPEAVAINERTNRIYVTHPGYGVTVIDGSILRVVAWIPIQDKSDINSIAVDPIINRIFVTSPWQNSVTVLDGRLNHVIRTVRVGKMPSGVAIDPARHILCTANTDGNSISFIRTTSFQHLGRIELQAPSQIAIDSKNHILYATSQNSPLLFAYEMNTRRLLFRVPLPEIPLGLVSMDL